MKVLTKNVKLYFECVTEGLPHSEVIESDPAELAMSGPPICPICNEEMAINDECLVAN